MKKFYTCSSAIVIALFVTITTYAQNIQWNTKPYQGFVFQITNREAQRLLTLSRPDTILNSLLHTRVDTFDTRNGWTHRPKSGHFILANIEGNKLHCRYTSVFPYHVFLLKEYDALSLQVLDLEGNVRKDAKVKFRLKRLPLDAESNTYRIANDAFYGATKFVTVELDGFRSVFNIEKHEAPSWYHGYHYDEGPDFYSYMISDKNKYKPGENVRFKSYALSHSRNPLHRTLEIWLTGKRSVKVGSISPHRPGSYAGEIQLHDSLKLTVDQHYNLQLRERNGRIVSDCNFKYEDYELNGNNLKVELKTTDHFFPDKNEVSILATDANGLLLKDAKAIVTVKVQTIRESYEQVVVLPDTLMTSVVDLDPDSATVVALPSGMFKKTNTAYQVNVTLRDIQNQLLHTSATAIYYYGHVEIVSRLSNDSIVYEMREGGHLVKNVPVTLSHDTDTTGVKVFLPYREKINPAVSKVSISSASVSKEILMRNLLPKLEVDGGIEKDSFNIVLHNPQKIDVAWYIYQGGTLITKGFGKALRYHTAIEDRTQTFYVELLYAFGGVEHVKRVAFEFRESDLNVFLDMPDRVYPGQEVQALIHVTNDEGYPVSGVDLTALAVNSKLDYHLQDIPYYGTSSSPRSMRTHYSKSDVSKGDAFLPLQYGKWNRLVGLDTMKYYQFTYPARRMFSFLEPIADSTQFAPYVMQDGDAKKIYVIEANSQPVYYSWAEQPRGYSFYVSPRGKTKISLRLFDRVLVFDSLEFKAGCKTIISIDLDHLPPNVKVIPIKNTVVKVGKRIRNFPAFTPTEQNRHNQYVAAFAFQDGRSYLQSGKAFTALFSPAIPVKRDTMLVGPIAPGTQTYFNSQPRLKTTYNHKGRYAYAFEDNIVYKSMLKKVFPERLQNDSYDAMATINDTAITKQSFLNYGATPDGRWTPRILEFSDGAARIRILLPEEKAASGVTAILYENCLTKQVLSPCKYYQQQSGFFAIPRGCFNIIVLYNNHSYLKIDGVGLLASMHAVIDFTHSPVNPPDQNSRAWSLAVYDRCYPKEAPKISVFRQPRRISAAWSDNIRGTIFDESKIGMPGTNIVVKGTSVGTVTDMDGRFSLEVDEPVVTLVVSFVGYKSEEIEVSIGSDVAVYMQPDVTSLEEVVVTGYGAVRQSYLTAAMSVRGVASGVQITGPDITLQAVADQERQEAEKKLYSELLTLNTIRQNFSDVAFWEPKLFTDRKGTAQFHVKFPDDITRWEATVFAMNRRLQTGTARKSIKSYKPIMAELHVPQFLTQGDSSFFQGRVLNYSQDEHISGKVKWEGSTRMFEKDIELAGSHADKFLVLATTTDSVTASYRFTRDDGYLDGEQRKIPVVEQGIVRADGTLGILNNNEEVVVRSANEPITVELLASQLDIYAGEARYLLDYKYDCNEQLASKLFGLISYKLIMTYEGKPFRHDQDVDKIVARLLKNQNAEFLWSWWDVSSNTSYWMSGHILRALKAAKDAGYEVALDIENIRRKAEYKFDMLNHHQLYDIDLLHALSAWNTKLNYAKYTALLDSAVKREEARMERDKRLYTRYSLLKEKFLLLEIRQREHLPYQRDSLLSYKQNGIMGDVHFTDRKRARYWYNDNLSLNTIAYRIIKADSSLSGLLSPLRLYFISQRSLGAWNTYHSSNILSTILPDILATGARKKQQAIVQLKGNVNASINKFPYRTELLPGQELALRKDSGLPVYYMQYRKERVTVAKTGVDGFKIKTQLGNGDGVMEAGKVISLLAQITVTKDAAAEYVMIEIPIPAACSYADKHQRPYPVETHREYFKDRTIIFCQNMTPGTYNFEVKLLPRFTGKYFINPAQVSLMYVPVVNANTDMKSIRVE